MDFDEAEAAVRSALHAARPAMNHPGIHVEAYLDWCDELALRISLIYPDEELAAFWSDRESAREVARRVSREAAPDYWPYVGFEGAREWRQVMKQRKRELQP